jgi:hypothetical protein
MTRGRHEGYEGDESLLALMMTRGRHEGYEGI